jgi:hypothetical protein
MIPGREGKARWCTFRFKQHLGWFKRHGNWYGKWTWQVSLTSLSIEKNDVLVHCNCKFVINIFDLIVLNYVIDAAKINPLTTLVMMLMSWTLEWKELINVHAVCLGSETPGSVYHLQLLNSEFSLHNFCLAIAAASFVKSQLYTKCKCCFSFKILLIQSLFLASLAYNFSTMMHLLHRLTG